ncbi:ferredoxin [Candidatus Micrarchaeota archaeon]|nr:ferredoxin [Candidatus Micrarchaeota archaeon]
MAVKVEVDKDACIGCGACVAICPDVFEMNDEGKSMVKTPEVDDSSCAEQAANGCPVQCIHLKKK